MNTIIETIYLFNELPEASKNKAIELNFDINTSYNWWNCTYEDALQIGIKITSFDIYRSDIEIKFIQHVQNVAEDILSNHGETCSTYLNAQKFLSSEMSEDDENCFKNEISEDYLNILNEEYNYLTSEEAISDTLIANEYYFDLTGNIR